MERQGIIAQIQSKITWLIPVFLTVIFVVICAKSISYKSPTRDEGRHLVRGVMLIEYHDYRLNKHHPVLANFLNAVPQIWNDDMLIPEAEGKFWDNADKDKLEHRFVRMNSDGQTRRSFTFNVLNRSRYVTIIAIAIFIPILFAVVQKYWGTIAATTFTTLFAFSPNIIAHSRLVTTDAWVIPLGLLGTIALWRHFTTNSRNSLIAFIFLGILGLLLKYSITPIAGLWIILLFYNEFRLTVTKNGVSKALLAATKKSAIVIGTWALILTAAYGFRFKTLASTNYENTYKTESHTRSIEEFSEKLNIPPETLKKLYFDVPWPFPEYIQGFIENVLLHDKFGHETFLFGQYSKHGWWYYFPAATLIKTPVPYLIGISAVLAWGGWISGQHIIEHHKHVKKMGVKKWIALHSWPKPWALFVFIPAFYIALSMKSSINLGIRHILVVFPFFYLGIALLVKKAWDTKGTLVKKCALRVPVLVLAAWYIWSAISIYPHYLEYFNELVGGPENGYKYLLDSNLSWAQDYFYVEDYIAEFERKNPDTPIYRNSEKQIPGSINIVDVDYLMGRDPRKYESLEWLREPFLAGEIEPIDRVAYTFLVFEVE